MWKNLKVMLLMSGRLERKSQCLQANQQTIANFRVNQNTRAHTHTKLIIINVEKFSAVTILELRQFKNGLASAKCMLVLNLPRFFPYHVGGGKRAAISKQTCFSQKRVRSYIVLALGAACFSLKL